MAKKIMITGVHGLIAGALYEHLSAQEDRYEVYGLARRRVASERVAGGRKVTIPENRFILADLSDSEAVNGAFEGMDVVIHMAAVPDADAPWERIHQSNVLGAYHVFEACRQNRVKRMVYASTVMVSWGWFEEEPYRSIRDGRYEGNPADIPIVRATDPSRPMDLYAASKVWGEALAYQYSREGLSSLCLRIGWVNKEDACTKADLGSVWCSQRDIIQLTERCINAPEDLMFDVFYGLSDNRLRWADIDHAREVVGYQPEDGYGYGESKGKNDGV